MEVFLDDERVSLRSRDDLIDWPVGAGRKKCAHKLLSLGNIERLERDRHRIGASRSPARSSLEEVRTGEAKQKEWRTQLFEELLEQRQERLFRPVQILQHDRSRRRTEAGLEISRHPDG